MIARGIGDKVADLYINWAFYYELNCKYTEADDIFRSGFKAHAEPMDLLIDARNKYDYEFGQELLHGWVNEERQQNRLEQMSSLHFNQTSVVKKKSLALELFDKKTVFNYCIPMNGAPRNHSIVNTQKFNDSVVALRQKRQEIKESILCHKDTEISKSSSVLKTVSTKLTSNLKSVPIKMPLPMVFNDEPDKSYSFYQKSLPGYDNILLNPADNVEFSPEELNAYKWFRNNSITNAFTLDQDMIWDVGYFIPIRWPKEFPHKNLPQPEWIVPRVSTSLDFIETKTHKFMCKMDKLYPVNEIEEYSLEELWKNRKSTTDFARIIAKQKKTKKSRKATEKQSRIPRFAIYVDKVQKAIKTTNRLSSKAFDDIDANKENIFIDENVVANRKGSKTKGISLNVLNKPPAMGFVESVDLFDVMNNATYDIEVEESEPITSKKNPKHESLNLFETTEAIELMEAICDVSPLKSPETNDQSLDLFEAMNNAMYEIEVDENELVSPKKNPKLEYSYSYELLETTADFEQMEAICALSPMSSPEKICQN